MKHLKSTVVILFLTLVSGSNSQGQTTNISSSWFSTYSGLQIGLLGARSFENHEFGLGLKWNYSRFKAPIGQAPGWILQYTYEAVTAHALSGLAFARYEGLHSNESSNRILINEFHFGFGMNYEPTSNWRLGLRSGIGGYIQKNSSNSRESVFKGISHCLGFDISYTL